MHEYSIISLIESTKTAAIQFAIAKIVSVRTIVHAKTSKFKEQTMNSAIIGISLGIVTIGTISLLKKLDKLIVYALILSGIGFLYVGFTWRDIPSFITTSVQAVCFLLLAFFGVKKNLYFLIAGYFLHGLWDIMYDLFFTSALIPPHYDLFCLSIDFTIGAYLLFLKCSFLSKKINN